MENKLKQTTFPNMPKQKAPPENDPIHELMLSKLEAIHERNNLYVSQTIDPKTKTYTFEIVINEIEGVDNIILPIRYEELTPMCDYIGCSKINEGCEEECEEEEECQNSFCGGAIFKQFASLNGIYVKREYFLSQENAQWLAEKIKEDIDEGIHNIDNYFRHGYQYELSNESIDIDTPTLSVQLYF